VVLPTVTFEDRMVLYDGEREIQLWTRLRRAHRRRRRRLPAERADLFAGDIAFLYVTPLAFQGHVATGSGGHRLLRFDADVIVPARPVGTKKISGTCATTRAGPPRSQAAIRRGMPRSAAADIKLGVYAS